MNKFLIKLVKDQHLTELLKGAYVSFVFRILGMMIGYIFTLVLARSYGAETMGVFTLSLTVLNISMLIAKLGLDTALLKFLGEYSHQDRWSEIHDIFARVILIVSASSILITIVTYSLSPYIAKYLFNKPYLSEYFQIISIAIVPFALLAVNREALRGIKSIKAHSILANILVGLFSVVFISVFIFYSDDQRLPVVSQVLALIISSIISFLIWFKLTHKKIGKNETKQIIRIKELLSVSIPMLITASMGMVMGWTDIIMLGVYASESDVGIYSVALKISMISSVFLVAINTIAGPKFAGFWGQRDMVGLSKIINQSTKLIFWTTLPVLVIILVFPEKILIIFGDSFTPGTFALMILAFGQFINSITGSVGLILNMTDNHKILQYTAIISAVINVLLNYILIPKYGVTGAAIATASSGIIWNILCVRYIKGKLGITTWYIPLLRG